MLLFSGLVSTYKASLSVTKGTNRNCNINSDFQEPFTLVPLLPSPPPGLNSTPLPDKLRPLPFQNQCRTGQTLLNCCIIIPALLDEIMFPFVSVSPPILRCYLMIHLHNENCHQIVFYGLCLTSILTYSKSETNFFQLID